MIFEYLKRLIHKGFIRLSLISEISGLILFYTNFDTRDVIVNFMTDYLSYIFANVLIIMTVISLATLLLRIVANI